MAASAPSGVGSSGNRKGSGFSSFGRPDASMEALEARVREAELFLPASLSLVCPPGFSAAFEQLARACDVSPWLVFGFFLPIVALLAGYKSTVKLDKHWWKERLIVWGALVAYSGTGKTPTYNMAVSALDEVMKIVRKQIAVKDMQEVELKAVDVLMEGKTTEQMLMCLKAGVNPERLICNDELSQFFAGLDSYHRGGSSDAKLILKWSSGNGWDGSSCGNPSAKVPVTHIIISGFIQPGPWLQYMQSRQAIDDGLCNKFLTLVPDTPFSMLSGTVDSEMEPYIGSEAEDLEITESTGAEDVLSDDGSFPDARTQSADVYLKMPAFQTIVQGFALIYGSHHNLLRGGVALNKTYVIAGPAYEAYEPLHDSVQGSLKRLKENNVLSRGGSALAKNKGLLMQVATLLHILDCVEGQDISSLGKKMLPSLISASAVERANILLECSFKQRVKIFEEDKTLAVVENVAADCASGELPDVTLDGDALLLHRIFKACKDYGRISASLLNSSNAAYLKGHRVKSIEAVLHKAADDYHLGTCVPNHFPIVMKGMKPYSEMGKRGFVFSKLIPEADADKVALVNNLSRLHLSLEDFWPNGVPTEYEST